MSSLITAKWIIHWLILRGTVYIILLLLFLYTIYAEFSNKETTKEDRENDTYIYSILYNENIRIWSDSETPLKHLLVILNGLEPLNEELVPEVLDEGISTSIDVFNALLCSLTPFCHLLFWSPLAALSLFWYLLLSRSSFHLRIHTLSVQTNFAFLFLLFCNAMVLQEEQHIYRREYAVSTF